MKRLFDLVNKEDKKNPLTDSEISKILGINRSEVVKLRQQNNIGSSRERRKDILESEIKRIVEENNNISVRTLTTKLKENGYDISRNAVSKYLNNVSVQSHNLNLDEKQNEPYVKKDELKIEDSFSTLVGAYGSLKPKIELAKAAILYPPNGLHTLIYGPTGVGKSELAECMYKFSIESGSKEQDASFIVFNCADYADNPQLLLAQLFGYTKGAFTGADKEREGLVEKADNGILFLDEIHRLPPEGQEILFYLIDKGKFRRLGESNLFREVNMMIIAATTEDIESSLLETFRRRIPMTIELPSLDIRPLKERLNIIEIFFRQEATRIGAKMIVNFNVLSALLLYDVKGNVGQLRSDIQVVCARAFLRYMVQKDKNMKIEICDLASHAASGLLRINYDRKKISELLSGDIEIVPYDEESTQMINETSYTLPSDVYKDIEKEYQKFQRQGIDIEIINRVISDELETKVQQIVKQIRYNKQDLIKQDLQNIVGERIINAVDKMVKIAEKRIENIDDSLFYCLATHLSASYERLLNNKKITNPQFNNIKGNYPLEYSVAEEMIRIAGICLGVEFPEDEIAFIAMYLRAYSKKDMLNVQNVGVVVLTHGHVAEGMVNVANRLLGEEHGIAVEMSLDESPKIALNRAEKVIIETNKGKGVLLLVDMGSLASFGNILSERTGIPIKTVSRVDTVMVIDAIRRAILPNADLNDMAESLKSDKYLHHFDLDESYSNKLNDVIISICLTGEGTADTIKDLIFRYFPDIKNKIEVITMGALSNSDLIESIKNISKNKNIIAVVGTMNPKLSGIKFIPAREIIKGDGAAKLKDIIRMGNKVDIRDIDETKGVTLNELIKVDLITLNAEFKDKNEVITYMASLMEEKGCVSDRFILSVHKREVMSSTVINGNIAIPHGNCEDVIKQAIGITILKNPIDWGDGFKVECVFMLALKHFNKEEFKKLYKILINKEIIDRMRKIKRAEELKEVIISDKKISIRQKSD